MPEGITRARLELCADRPCTRMVRMLEVTGDAIRPEERLAPGVVFWRVRGLRPGGSVAWTSATWEFEVGHRDAPNDISYGTIHDVNGDGYSDVVAGNHNHDRIEVYRGGAMRLEPPEDLVPTREQGGFALSPTLGDFNGDGLADLVGWGSGGRLEDLDPLYSFRGRPGASMEALPLLERPDTRGLCNAGDIDGDGYLDIIRCGEASSLEWGGGFSARRLPTRLTPGCEQCAGADLNGDGYADLLLSVGRILGLVPGGPDGPVLSSRIELVLPTTTNYEKALSAGGDLNGDGLPDFCVAQLRYVECYAGVPGAYPFRPTLRFETPDSLEFGYTTARMSMQGDYNGDGRCDLAFGHNTASVRPAGPFGFIYVFNGHPVHLIDRMSRVDLFAVGPFEEGVNYSNYPIGSDVSAGGDVNGDGFDDLIVGAGSAGPYEIAEFRDNGAVDVFLGGSSGLRRDLRWRVDGRPGGTHWGHGLGTRVE
ncbi:MAG: FG-GAP repeat protein [Deltaproteobacteria bacterium]|nr:FG-GAP repeat protein [Deltaproteobacteria bacterium]